MLAMPLSTIGMDFLTWSGRPQLETSQVCRNEDGVQPGYLDLHKFLDVGSKGGNHPTSQGNIVVVHQSVDCLKLASNVVIVNIVEKVFDGGMCLVIGAAKHLGGLLGSINRQERFLERAHILQLTYLAGIHPRQS